MGVLVRKLRLELALVPLLVMAFLLLLLANLNSHWSEGEVMFGHGDGHYISQVSSNLLAEKGYSYWNGYGLVFWDYEISTGPVVIYPQALLMALGLSKYDAFYYLPLALNLSIFCALLCYWRRYLSPVEWVATTAVLVGYFVLYWRWLWYLPLGEVQSLLWLLFALSVMLFGPKGAKSQLGAGIFAGLALLSKMMLILALPLLGGYLLINQGWRALGRFTLALLAVCGSFIISIYLTAPSHIGLTEMADHFMVFLRYSFGWAFPEILISPEELQISWWFKFITNVRLLDGSVWSDKFNAPTLLVLHLLALTLAAIDIYRRRKVTLFGLMVLGLVMAYFAWALLVGLKTYRYAFILFSLLLCTALFLAHRLGERAMLATAASLCCAMLAIGADRGWVFPAAPDRVRELSQVSALLDEFMQREGVAKVSVTGRLYRPYLLLAYHMRDSESLVSVYHHLDQLPIVEGRADCETLPRSPISFYHYYRNPNSFVSWCQLNKLPLVFDWPDAPSTLWVLDYLESPRTEILCREQRWRHQQYVLYQCSLDELKAFWTRDSGNLLRFTR